MDWINTVQGLIALITGLVGLVTTGVGAFLTIKAFIKNMKEKSAKEQWAIIVTAADAAMKEAEHSGKTGADKKTMVMQMVSKTCEAAGLNIDLFLAQLDAYIDQTISFVNGMTK